MKKKDILKILISASCAMTISLPSCYFNIYSEETDAKIEVKKENSGTENVEKNKMNNIPTPHIEAQKGDFAKTVLMPGDPLRAKYIADKYLNEVKCVNKVRNMLGYTGLYKGKEVSIMSSGMGMPSIICVYLGKED